MPPDDLRRITDLDTLKALSHPLRLRLYRALFHARTATASQLADQVDEAVSLVSYHLRKLASHGVIEEATPQSGDGRERWWRIALRSYSVMSQDFRDEPERAAAYTAFTRLSFSEFTELYQGFLDQQQAWAQEWRTASFNTRSLPRLTAEELRLLAEDLRAVVKKWQERGDAAVQAGDTEGRENVVLHMFGFPTRP